MRFKLFAFAASAALGGVIAMVPLHGAFSTPDHPSTATPPPAADGITIAGDAARGAVLFVAKCAKCHGAKGAGSSVAPPLRALKTRRGTAAAIVWIKDPQPPMPKLYPKVLSDKDVNDIIVYLESL